MNEDIPNKCLPFSLFLIEHLEREYINGRILTYYAARSEALPQWNHLTKKEREEYKEKANEKSEFIRTTLEHVFNMDKKLAKIKSDEVERVKAMVKKFTRDSIEDTKDWKLSTIILGSVNIFAKSSKNIYPAELALLKFNVTNGIYDKMNVHISSFGLPIGLLNEATQLAEETHKIAPDEQCFEKFKEIELDEVKKQIKTFLGSQNVIFSLSDALNKYDDIEATSEVLKNIFGIKEVAVSSLLQVLMALQTRNNQPPSDNLNLHAKFEKNHWENFSIGCMHHFEVDAPKYCTLARVKRWAYKICCLILPQSEVKAGIHSPDPFKTEPDRVTQYLLTLTPPSIRPVENETLSTHSSSCREKYMEAASSLPIIRPFAVAPFNADEKNESLPFDFDELMINDFESDCLSQADSSRTQEEYIPFDLSDIM